MFFFSLYPPLRARNVNDLSLNFMTIINFHYHHPIRDYYKFSEFSRDRISKFLLRSEREELDSSESPRLS